MILPLYGCRKDGNECEKKELCKRYNEEPNARLWAEACNESNSYQLFLAKEEEVEIKE